jgi:hypothetical protein
MPMHSDRRTTRRWAKIGPPLRGRVGKAAGVVPPLAQATSLRVTSLLSSSFPDTMTMLPTKQIKLMAVER